MRPRACTRGVCFDAGGLLEPESRSLPEIAGEHLVLWRAHVSANPVLLDEVDHDLIPELIATNQELDGFVSRPVLLLELIIIDFNRDIVLVFFGIRLEQRKINVAHATKWRL